MQLKPEILMQMPCSNDYLKFQKLNNHYSVVMTDSFGKDTILYKGDSKFTGESCFLCIFGSFAIASMNELIVSGAIPKHEDSENIAKTVAYLKKISDFKITGGLNAKL